MISCYILTIACEEKDSMKWLRTNNDLPYLIPGIGQNEWTCGPGKMQLALSVRLSTEQIERLQKMPEFVALEPEYK